MKTIYQYSNNYALSVDVHDDNTCTIQILKGVWCKVPTRRYKNVQQYANKRVWTPIAEPSNIELKNLDTMMDAVQNMTKNP